jgi:hypothetical protein
MYLLQSRKYDMLKRVLQFIGAYSDLFPEHSIQYELAATIRSSVEDLDKYSVNQVTGFNKARAGTIHKTKAGAALRRHLNEISRTARLIARTATGFEQPFKLPREKDYKTLLDFGRQVAAKASENDNIFRRYGMRPDFVDELKTTLAKFEAAHESRMSSRADHRTASAGMNASLKRAMNALHQLDVIMANILRDRPREQTGWRFSRHLTRTRRKAAAAAAASSLEPSSAPDNSSPDGGETQAPDGPRE